MLDGFSRMPMTQRESDVATTLENTVKVTRITRTISVRTGIVSHLILTIVLTGNNVSVADFNLIN